MTTLRIIMAISLLAFATACEDPFTEDPRVECRENCEDLGFFDCANDDRIAECGRQCNLRSESVVTDFNTCKSGGICRSAGCLDVLIPGSSANNSTNGSTNSSTANQMTNNNEQVDECKFVCDAVGACLEVDRAGTVIDCKAACDESSSDMVTSFITCERSASICEDDVVCFEFLGVPYTYP